MRDEAHLSLWFHYDNDKIHCNAHKQGKMMPGCLIFGGVP